MTLLDDLPGEDLIRKGLDDFLAGRDTIEACLVEIAQPRLIAAGLIDPASPLRQDSELRLYRLLQQEPGDAYPRYNALLRRLQSFEHALDSRRRKDALSFSSPQEPPPRPRASSL